jgi:hypothetical protein
VRELELVDLFQVRDTANVDGIPPGLPEHIGADQPLYDDREPGSEVIPLHRVAEGEE